MRVDVIKNLFFKPPANRYLDIMDAIIPKIQ